jgi:hypothetical protein
MHGQRQGCGEGWRILCADPPPPCLIEHWWTAMPFGLLFFWCVLMPITADWSGGPLLPRPQPQGGKAGFEPGILMQEKALPKRGRESVASTPPLPA